jgi:hypothetical protein
MTNAEIENNGKTKGEAKNGDAELGIQTKKWKFWLRVSKNIITNRLFIALLASSLGVGGSELRHLWKTKDVLVETSMCREDVVIKVRKENYTHICGCWVKLEDIEKKGNETIAELSCSTDNESVEKEKKRKH